MLNLEQIFAEELTRKEAKNFFNNLEIYKQMWIERGDSFWMKYVLTLRELLITEGESRDELDSLFFDLLQVFLLKDFEYLVQFVNETYKGKLVVSESLLLVRGIFIKSLHFKLRCAGAFVRLLDVPNKYVNIPWICPASWALPRSSTDFLNLYIKTHWGNKFFEMLGCKKEQVGWWDPLSRNTKAEHLKNYQLIPNCLPAPYLRDPISKLDKNVSKFHCRFPRIFLNCSEVTIAPYLARKFHNVSVHLLVENNIGFSCLSTAAWFVGMQETMDMQFHDIVQLIQVETAVFLENSLSIKTDPGQVDFRINGSNYNEHQIEANKMIVSALTSQGLKGRPMKAEEFPATRAEFLLEPHILAQLPFKPVLLQQWLCAALIQILEYEKKTLELRHWPLSRDVEPCARKLLTLVKEAKECIIIAVMMFSNEVNNYPLRNLNYAESIMDRCVLPATATLDFICSGSADQALKVIKNISWSQSHKVSTGSTQTFATMSPEAYTIDETLQSEYISHIFHAFCVLKLPHSFLKANACNTEYFENLFQMKDKEISPKGKLEQPSVVVNPFNHEELMLHEISFKNDTTEEVDSVNYFLVKTMEAIKTHVIEKKYFPKSSEVILLKMLSGMEAKSFTPIFNKSVTTISFVHQAIIYSQMYWRCSAHLHGIEEEDNSVVSWIIRLSGEVIERQLLVRLCMACCLCLGDTPVIAEQSGVESLTLEAIEKSIDAVCKESKNRSRNWLWEQLSPDRRKLAGILNLSQNFDVEKSRLVEDLELRLCKLLLNIAQHSFNMWKKSCKLFTHWSTLQYLMPCYISLLLDLCLKNDNSYRSKNLVKFLNGLFEFYETEYSAWVQAPHTWKRTKVLQYGHDLVGITYSCEMSKGCFSQEISQLMNAYVGPLKMFCNFEDRLFLNNDWFSAFSNWPIILNKDLNEIDMLICRTWQNVGFSHCQDLLRICTEVWRPPLPGAPLSCKPLSDVYFSNAVISALEVLMKVQCVHAVQGMYYSEFQMPKENAWFLIEWRYQLLQKVVQIEGLVPSEKKMSEDEILNFCKQGNEIFVDMYSILATFHRNMTQKKVPFTKIPSFPSSEKVTLRNAVNDFADGKIANMAKLLNLKVYKNCKKGEAYFFRLPQEHRNGANDKKTDTNKKKTALPITNQQRTAPMEDILHRCMCCDKTETNPGNFSACQNCLSEGYPEINYFCSPACQEIWWEREHMAEHLEFKLGLGAWYVEKKD